jgi:hypothetical protein
METGLVTGVRGAAGACEAEVAGRGEAFATAALLTALSGEEKVVAPLVEALGDDDVVGPALFALGFTGRVAAADALLELMERDEKLAPLAAEGFCTRARRREALSASRLWRPKGLRGRGRDLRPQSDSQAVPETIAGWWKEARPRLDARKRWPRGSRASSARPRARRGRRGRREAGGRPRGADGRIGVGDLGRRMRATAGGARGSGDDRARPGPLALRSGKPGVGLVATRDPMADLAVPGRRR